jgi:aerobic carbon-monoxide dehydrogenase large subunit
VKLPYVEYEAPTTIAEAVDLLAKHKDEASVLAGGQSLIPLLALRLARPAVLIDINGLGELSGVSVTDGWVAIGAMTREYAAEESETVANTVPLLAAALPLIGHEAIRSRGTIGGSLAHTDPAAELPAVARALDAEFVARSWSGDRVVPAAEWFEGYLTTSRRPDEILVEVRFPTAGSDTGVAFQEVARRHGDFAVDDIKLPGMLHAAFVRSPLAHGRVLAVDVSAARALPGVVTVLTGTDLEAMTVPGPDPMLAMMGGGGPMPEYTLLATDKVRFVGDPVAVVVAESRYVAEDGCELVEVDYEDLPPVASAAVALDSGSPPVFANLGNNIVGPRKRSEFGDVAGTFAAADRIAEFHIDVHRHQNVPMEGRGCVASHDAGSGLMTVYAATQSVHITRMGVAMRLGIEPDKVHVLAGDIGGSFGLKIGASREELAVAAASRALGRPVKWVEDRSENLTASGQAREESFDVRTAVSHDGDLLGLDAKMVIDTGAYPVMGTMVPAIMEMMLPGPYKLAAMGFESTAVTTNKASYVAYRGPWASETFVRERVLDLLAKDLGLDPLEVRLRNVAPRTDPPFTMITGRPLVGVTSRESLERIAQIVDVPAFRRRQAEERARGRYLGIGVATFIEAAPGPRSPEGPSGPMGMESMRLMLAEDGVVTLFTGQMPHGQSHQTTLAQIAADEFGVPFEQVRVVVGDSSVVPFGLTGGSRSATMTGGVALHGTRELKAKVLDFASHLMEASARDLEITDG